MTPVTIKSVTSRETLRGKLWRIVDTDGQRYSTYDPWQASLCKEAMKVQQPVVIWSGAGWHDRQMRAVKFAGVAVSA